MLYADIKGLPWASREVQATQLLQQVRMRVELGMGGMRIRESQLATGAVAAITRVTMGKLGNKHTPK